MVDQALSQWGSWKGGCPGTTSAFYWPALVMCCLQLVGGWEMGLLWSWGHTSNQKYPKGLCDLHLHPGRGFGVGILCN